MFSRIASKGTTIIADPKVEDISIKLSVVFPTSVEKGGGRISGKPGLTNPVKLKGLDSWTSNSQAIMAPMRTTIMFLAVEINQIALDMTSCTVFRFLISFGPTLTSLAF